MFAHTGPEAKDVQSLWLLSQKKTPGRDPYRQGSIDTEPLIRVSMQDPYSTRKLKFRYLIDRQDTCSTRKFQVRNLTNRQDPYSTRKFKVRNLTDRLTGNPTRLIVHRKSFMSKIPDSINNHPNTGKKQIRDASKRDVIRVQLMAHEARWVSGERISQPSLNAAAEEQMKLKWNQEGIRSWYRGVTDCGMHKTCQNRKWRDNPVQDLKGRTGPDRTVTQVWLVAKRGEVVVVQRPMFTSVQGGQGCSLSIWVNHNHKPQLCWKPSSLSVKHTASCKLCFLLLLSFYF